MRTSFRVARIFGIAIEVHISWLLIFAVLAWTLSDRVFPATYEDWTTTEYWVVGTLAALLLFLTVLLHELAHALVAIRRGLPVPRITLFIFGGVSQLGRQPASAREELAIAIAGPITSFIAAAVCLVVAVAASASEQASATFGYLAVVNVMLGAFNLLPGFPLDGGRVLRGLAWERTGSFRQATRLASTVGEYFAYGMLALGAFLLLSGLPTNGLWLMLIAWFLLGAARGELAASQVETALAKLTAADVLDGTYGVVGPASRVADVVEKELLAQGHRAVLVASNGRLDGILTVSDLRKVDRDHWPATPVSEAMTPAAQVVAVPPNMPAMDVLALISEKRLNQVPVLSNGETLGLVSRKGLVERLAISEAVEG
ncbi:MAG: site-2 protease family protein [Tepidiformaceae bacterium]